MKNKLVKQLSIIAVVLSIAIIGTACGKSSNVNENATTNASANATESTNEANNSASTNDSAAANNGASTDEAVSEENAPTVMSGVFNGINADKTIDIETGVGALSYKASAEIADKVSKWEAGTKVKFEYKEDTITTIDKE